jgi:hypothetical protein
MRLSHETIRTITGRMQRMDKATTLGYLRWRETPDIFPAGVRHEEENETAAAAARA